MITNPSNFCCAALPSICQHAQGVFKAFPDYMSNETLGKFFDNNVNKFLTSYGLGIAKGKKIDERVTTRYKKIFDNFKSQKYLANAEITVDSGGFQLQTPGYGSKEETSILIDLYYDFLQNHQEGIDYAFNLDIAPGASSCLYDSWNEIEYYNELSCEKAGSLPKEIRDKILYIHHFRTPAINKIWKDMLFNKHLADPFKNFATGGLVSFSNSAQLFPIALYVVPMIHILLYAKDRELNKFRWHTLGSSEFKDIVFHKFAEYHIKKVHNIDVEITYDSSTIFKVLAMSRFVYIPNWEYSQLWKMTIREADLHRFFKEWGTHEEVFYRFVNEATVPYGMKELKKEESPLYVDGRLTRVSYMYGILHLLKLFADVDRFCVELVKKLYPIYENGDIHTFDREIEKIMIGFNDGKISRRLNSRTISIANSLDALTNLDIQYCDYLVDRYMSADECSILSGGEACIF